MCTPVRIIASCSSRPDIVRLKSLLETGEILPQAPWEKTPDAPA
ncbi:hypothetical protein [Streptacidiphilus sp. PAMC 29251]